MKKVRVMLTAITVLAVVSGALAFKANKGFGHGNRYCRADSGTCPTTKEYNAISTGTDFYCSTVSGGSCTSTIKASFVGE